MAALWDSVRPGVEEIKKLCNEPWIPEDVYASLKADRATLFLCITDKPVGFLVLEVCPDPHGNFLNVWLMKLPDAESYRADLVGSLDDLARKANCKRIRFMSPRLGWMKFVKEDFKLKAVIYERAV